MEQYFQYGEKEIAYLKGKDKRLADIIDKIGLVKRRVIPDLFPALVHSIIGSKFPLRHMKPFGRNLSVLLRILHPKKYLICHPKHYRHSA